MKIFGLILCIISIVSCKNTEKAASESNEGDNTVVISNNSGTSTKMLEGTFQIGSVYGKEATANSATITFSGKNRVSGNTGCNDFSGFVTVKGNRLTFSPMTVTEAICDGKMTIEKQIIKAFTESSTYQFSEKNLELIKTNGDVILTATIQSK